VAREYCKERRAEKRNGAQKAEGSSKGQKLNCRFELQILEFEIEVYSSLSFPDIFEHRLNL
jgi:hypothetical protein